jgi:hypothetical protein
MPHADVDVSLHSTPVQLGTFPTDGTGSFTTNVTIPADTPVGAHSIVLSGTDARGRPATVTLALTVQDPTALAHTGGSSAPLALTGLLLIGVGALTTRARRFRPYP